MKLLAGVEGKSKLDVRGRNNAPKGQFDLPIGLTDALAGSTSATVQMVGSDAPRCFSATFTDVINNDALMFRAK